MASLSLHLDLGLGAVPQSPGVLQRTAATGASLSKAMSEGDAVAVAGATSTTPSWVFWRPCSVLVRQARPALIGTLGAVFFQ